MRDWSTSNRTIRAQREAGRADVPDMPEPKPEPVRTWCVSCGGRQAFIAPAPSQVVRCLDCGHEEGWPVCQVCEAGDVVDGTCVQCGAREV
jgi:ribosomal protein S27E